MWNDDARHDTERTWETEGSSAGRPTQKLEPLSEERMGVMPTRGRNNPLAWALIAIGVLLLANALSGWNGWPFRASSMHPAARAAAMSPGHYVPGSHHHRSGSSDECDYSMEHQARHRHAAPRHSYSPSSLRMARSAPEGSPGLTSPEYSHGARR